MGRVGDILWNQSWSIRTQSNQSAAALAPLYTSCQKFLASSLLFRLDLLLVPKIKLLTAISPVVVGDQEAYVRLDRGNFPYST